MRQNNNFYGHIFSHYDTVKKRQVSYFQMCTFLIIFTVSFWTYLNKYNKQIHLTC